MYPLSLVAKSVLLFVIVPLSVACDRGNNQALVAGNDSLSIAPGETVLVDVLANDSTLAGGLIELVEITSAPAKGAAVIVGQMIRYTANANSIGIDELEYLIEDEFGSTAVGRLLFAISVVDDDPCSPKNLVPSTEPFIVRWKTDNPGITADNQIELPLTSEGVYDFIVDWGDGTQSTIMSWDDPDKRHTYAAPGEYDVSIQGVYSTQRNTALPFGGSDAEKQIAIKQWGDMQWLSVHLAFAYTSIGSEAPADVPDLSCVRSMSAMFLGAQSFNQPLANWDVSNVTGMYRMFYGAQSFNQPLDNWDVSNVTDMESMFYEAQSFNQDISSWNVLNVSNYLFFDNDSNPAWPASFKPNFP